jgi:extensin-like protein
MTRGVRWYLVSSLVLVALIALAGCSHYLLAEREPWRHEAELSCLNSGAVKETPERVRISPVGGAGACGIDYPIRVSALGDSAPMSYDDEPIRPPGAVPDSAMPRRWPGAQPGAVASSPIQSSVLPPVQGATPQPYLGAPQTYPAPRSTPTAQVGQPLSLEPPGLSPPDDDEDIGIPGGPPHPYYGGPSASPYSPRQAPLGANEPRRSNASPLPPLGPPSGPMVTASVGPVEVQPPATLACPIVSALDQWISTAVQPAAQHWFRRPVVEIKQISAYSCRGMNGDPNAHISEHAFGNALDVAEFDLADGHKVSVQYGWKGTPEEQGFLHDVQLAACDSFTTVLAPGANVYHYNHIHVDLMRHYNGRHICEPAAIPGEVVAERARSHFAAQHPGEHYNDPGVTGSIKVRALAHAAAKGQDDDSLPEAVPGDD